MEKKRLQIIITAVLALVFILAWGNTFKALKKRAGQKASSLAPAVSVAGPAAADVLPPEEGIQDEDDRMKWGRDPFSGKVYSSTESKISDLRCSGIIWDKVSPVAMINDRVVKVGDRISGNVVKEIKPDRVILNDGNRDFEIKVN